MVRNIIIGLALISIAGLGFYQYKLMINGLRAGKVLLDHQMGNTLKALENDLSFNNELSYLIGTAIEEDTSYFNISPSELRDTATYFLNDFLKYLLEINGIKAGFEFQLQNGRGNAVLSSNPLNPDKGSFQYRAALEGYLNLLSHDQYFIIIELQNVPGYLLSNQRHIWVPGIVFFVLLTFCLFWIARVYQQEVRINYLTNDFINNLTHELNTPVFSIGMAARMLKGKENGYNQDKLVDIIIQDNDRLKVHIQKVLSLAKIRSEKQILQYEMMDLKELIFEITGFWKKRIELNQGHLTLDVEGDKFFIKGDIEHIRNAIDNVFDNAVKYSHDPPQVFVRLFKYKRTIRLSIADKGIGMEQKYSKAVFEKFYRIPYLNSKREVPGFGLGLTYVKNIMKLHKGSVSISGIPGQGTEVVLTFKSAVDE